MCCRVGCGKGEIVFISSLLCIILSRINMPYVASFTYEGKFKKNKARGSHRGRKDIGSFHKGPATSQSLLILMSTKAVGDSKYYF